MLKKKKKKREQGVLLLLLLLSEKSTSLEIEHVPQSPTSPSGGLKLTGGLGEVDFSPSRKAEFSQ